LLHELEELLHELEELPHELEELLHELLLEHEELLHELEELRTVGRGVSGRFSAIAQAMSRPLERYCV
jgi:predicted nuclease with TOPRIM domain